MEKNENRVSAFTKDFWSNAYQTNIGKLIGICYRYTGNQQLSEDLAHDAFLKAIEKSPGFRGDGNFDAWLRRIAVNHVLQYLRDQKRIPYTEQLSPDHTDAVTAQENTPPTKPMEFTAVELLETIARLPEHHRLVFNLYVFEKFSHARIGEELSISEGTSKSHLARARRKLQQLLTGKAAIQKAEENEERAAVFLFATDDDARMEQVLTESLEQFSIPPKNAVPGNFSQQTGRIFPERLFSKISLRAIIASSIIISFSLVIFLSLKSISTVNRKNSNAASVPDSPNKNAAVQEKNIENLLPPTATNSQDSVNTSRKLKLYKMKPLDSLALLLALSASTVNTPSLKDSVRSQILKPETKMLAAAVDSNLRQTQPEPAVPGVISRDERGSFRASRLFWDNDDMEVYFKGEVSVDFKDQHFKGNGSFTILGKVRLLIVDGQQVASGKTIKLSDEDYHLAVLNSTEAASKYGDAGKYGAVLIYRSN